MGVPSEKVQLTLSEAYSNVNTQAGLGAAQWWSTGLARGRPWVEAMAVTLLRE